MQAIKQELFTDKKIESKSDFTLKAGTGVTLSATPFCLIFFGCDTDTDTVG